MEPDRRADEPRRRRLPILAVVSATLLVIGGVVGGVVWAGSLMSQPDEPTTVAGPGATPVDLPTSSWTPGRGGHQALISGTLALDDDGCVVLDASVDGDGYYLAWPASYSAAIHEDGVRLYDARGAEVARGGDLVRMGGGYAPVGDPHPCLPEVGTEIAWVQSEVEVVPD